MKKSERLIEWTWLASLLSRFGHIGPRARMGVYAYPAAPLSNPGTRQRKRRKKERRSRGGRR